MVLNFIVPMITIAAKKQRFLIVCFVNSNLM